MGCFNFYYVESLEQIPPCVQTGINYPQALFSTKLMKFTVLYTATMNLMKGGKLRKS